MQSAKQLQKLKHIRKVKAAIRYQEKTKERLAPVKKENKETKQYILQSLEKRNERVKGDVRAARKNAREDWNLGPLRPNRAASKLENPYGAVGRDSYGAPQVPEHWFGASKNVQKRMKMQIPKHIKDNNWPIVEGDRVVIIRGQDKNKIGIVLEVSRETNEITVKDLNKTWIDERLFAQSTERQSKRERELPMPYDDVRLVVRYNSTIERDGVPVEVSQDVIVEDVVMEKHTTGVNPFTLENEHAIPEEEQVYPETGEVIWHRYIAGTRQKIKWPWENPESQDKKNEDKSAKNKDRNVSMEEEHQGVVAKIRNMLGRKSKSNESTAESSKSATSDDLAELDEDQPPRAKPTKLPPNWDDDTTRNIVENIADVDQFVPTLVYPPLPDFVIDELRNKYQPSASLPSKDHPDYEARRQGLVRQKHAAREQVAQAKQEFIDTMKTPMEVKRDLELKKRAELREAQPKELNGNLMRAIGELMEKNGKGFTRDEFKGWKDAQRMNKQEAR